MKTSSPPLFLSSLFLLALIPLHGTAQNLIQTTCKTCSQQDPNVPYDFCTTSLQAAPASRGASLRDLGMISFRLTRSNLTDTRGYIKHLLKNNKTDDMFFTAALDDCFDLYSDAIPSIQQAMNYYNAKRYVDANVTISSFIDAGKPGRLCEDGFTGREGIDLVSPLTNRNDDASKLFAMVRSIIHIVQTGSN